MIVTDKARIFDMEGNLLHEQMVNFDLPQGFPEHIVHEGQDYCYTHRENGARVYKQIGDDDVPF